ncbi:MAG TPA: TolC family protein, partial [Allocoleopsis sp.]
MSFILRNHIKKVSILFAFLNFLFLNSHSFAQNSVLSLDEAISRALKNNFGIQIAQNDVLVAKNNAVKANAGFLPTVNLTATELPSIGYLNQKLSNGNEINRTNISNN